MRERVEKTMNCLRCAGRMNYAGTRQFHEAGPRGGIIGGISDLFRESDNYDVYFCVSCGKVEFYVDGIGDAGRGELPKP